MPAHPLRVAVKMYSPILEGYLWVVQDAEDWPRLKEAGDPVYDAREIRELEGKGLPPEMLKAAHEAKRAFKGSRVEKHEK